MAAFVDETKVRGLLVGRGPGSAHVCCRSPQPSVLPLFEHDQAHGTALVQTLRTFLDVDRATKTAAGRVALAVGVWAWARRPRGRSSRVHAGSSRAPCVTPTIQ